MSEKQRDLFGDGEPDEPPDEVDDAWAEFDDAWATAPDDVKTEPLAPFQPASETSHQAAEEKSEDSRVTERMLVLATIKGSGERGISRDGLSETLGRSVNKICPRVWELLGSGGRHKPLICETKERRETRSGGKAAVLKVL